MNDEKKQISLNDIKNKICLHDVKKQINLNDVKKQISQHVLRTSFYDAQRQISSLQVRLQDAQAENERLHEKVQGMCTVCIGRSAMRDCMIPCQMVNQEVRAAG